MWDVHCDFNPPPPYDTMFDPDYRGDVNGEDFENGTVVHAGMAARDLAHVVALYDGEIRYTDGYGDRLLDLLRQRHVLDDTLVVVTSDHGEEFYEHGMKGHRQQLYDESIRIPLVIRYPARVPAGTVVNDQVLLVDVAPTIPAHLRPGPDPNPLRRPQPGPMLSKGAAASVSIPACADLEPQGLTAIRYPNHKLIGGPLWIHSRVRGPSEHRRRSRRAHGGEMD